MAALTIVRVAAGTEEMLRAGAVKRVLALAEDSFILELSLIRCSDDLII